LIRIDVDKQVLVVVKKEVRVEILDLLMEILDMAMWSSKLMDLLM